MSVYYNSVGEGWFKKKDNVVNEIFKSKNINNLKIVNESIYYGLSKNTVDKTIDLILEYFNNNINYLMSGIGGLFATEEQFKKSLIESDITDIFNANFISKNMNNIINKADKKYKNEKIKGKKVYLFGNITLQEVMNELNK